MDMSEIEVDVPVRTDNTGWGSRLREAREARGLSVERVASELRLGVKLLRAIEHEETAVLPTPPFVKGYLRGYARLLELDADPIIEVYSRACGDEPPAMTRIAQLREIKSDDSWPRYATWGVIGIIAVSFLVWWSARILTGNGQQVTSTTASLAPAVEERPAPQPEPSFVPATPAAPVPVTTQDEIPTVAAPALVPQAPEPTSEPEAEEVVAPPPSTEGEPAVLQADQAGAVTFEITEESWVEITDAAGARLFYGLAQAGSRRTVQGVPPYRIILGNAKGVALLYNGEPFDTTLYERNGVARLSLGE